MTETDTTNYYINSVLINLSGSNLARNMWFWMSGESMTFTKWPQDSAPSVNSNRCGAMESGELHLWQDQPCEERLNFICQSRRGVVPHILHVYTYQTSQYLNQLFLSLRSCRPSRTSLFLQHPQITHLRLVGTTFLNKRQ